MKRKTVYNFNSVQLTFNQCVFNRIQDRTEHNLYSTRLDNSTDNSTESRLTIQSWQLDWRSDNSTGNSALQFGLTTPLYNSAPFTIPLYNSVDNFALQFVPTISSDEFVLTNSTYNSALQFWLTKMGKTIRASEQRLYRGPKRVSRVEPSLADVSRIWRSNGKGNPWQGQFLVARFW